MNIKKILVWFVFGLGLILGAYWFILTESYFLLFLGSLIGLILGYVLGTEIMYHKVMKNVDIHKSKINNC